MKNLFVFAAIFLGVSFFGCQDAKEEIHNPDISFYKAIGTQIPFETGMRWMKAYYEKPLASGKLDLLGLLDLTPYTVSSENLQLASESVDNLVGIGFQHAIDDNGVHHFILIPFDESLGVWTNIAGRIYIDSNTDSPISQETAHAWALRYQGLHPNEIWFHFFGSDIFADMQTLSFFSEFEIEPALNDLNLTPQLLLLVEDNLLGSITGRLNSQSTMTYDASSPCPPCPAFR
jgi:hypothetical protein